ncbi:MAG: ferritin-like domain-containing protein [Acidimicrobiia bacterium]|nr:ferritin-like domain-containing protein [Acidimicrobiia bacterium]MBV9040713.1 ferritin-like domain-containing protein [Acidimicrobiia bacterium]
MRVSYDERALASLAEESQDLQADAMRATQEPLAELVEQGREQRAHGGIDGGEIAAFNRDRGDVLRTRLGTGALAAAGFGAALLKLFDSPAFADQAMDVQILQTAASLENLAVATYGVALTLPFIGGGAANPVVKAFAMKTKDQHAEHAKAFNAAIAQLGGKAQTNPDPVLLDVVNKAKPTLTGPGPVVDLAIKLETGAAETYNANVAALGDLNARKVTASIMGVEAQHVAVLNAVKALVAGGHPELIALPPNAAALPAAAGSVGFPDAFLKTDQARPADEGAVK